MSSAQTQAGKEPATLQSTRQILDELDALMDRMLAIPVNDMDEPLPPARSIIHIPTVSATLTVLEEPPEEEVSPREEREMLQKGFPSYTADVEPEPRLRFCRRRKNARPILSRFPRK